MRVAKNYRRLHQQLKKRGYDVEQVKGHSKRARIIAPDGTFLENGSGFPLFFPLQGVSSARGAKGNILAPEALERTLIEMGALGTEEERMADRQERLDRARQDPRAPSSSSKKIEAEILGEDDAPDRSDRNAAGVGIIRARRSRPPPAGVPYIIAVGGRYSDRQSVKRRIPPTRAIEAVASGRRRIVASTASQAKESIVEWLESEGAPVPAGELREAIIELHSKGTYEKAIKALRAEGIVEAIDPEGRAQPIVRSNSRYRLACTIDVVAEDGPTDSPEDAGRSEMAEPEETLKGAPESDGGDLDRRLKEALLAKIEDASVEEALELARMIQEMG